MSDFEAIFTEHIQTLERHARLLSEAAQHFRTAPRASPNNVEVQEIQNMHLHAQQSLIDAQRCQQLFLHMQAAHASQTQGSHDGLKRAWSCDQTDPLQDVGMKGGLTPLLDGSVKRRRVDKPVREGNVSQNKSPLPRRLDADESRRNGSQHGLEIPEEACRPGSHVTESYGIHIYNPMIYNQWTTPECLPLEVQVEYEDINAEVEARIQASEKRRKENSGELQKKAVKRTWKDRDSMGSAEVVDALETGSRRAEKKSRRRDADQFGSWPHQQANGVSTSA